MTKKGLRADTMGGGRRVTVGEKNVVGVVGGEQLWCGFAELRGGARYVSLE